MTPKIFKKYKINTLVNISILNLKGSIDETVLQKVKEKYEGKCMKEGLVRKDSIKILKRSAGKSMKEHFNSSYYYYAQCIAEICNPDYNSIVKCTIVNSNNAGYIGLIEDHGSTIINVVIPRLTAGIQHEKNIDDIKEKDQILVRVIGKKINLFDTNMIIIGCVIKDENDDEKVLDNDDINSVANEINDIENDNPENDQTSQYSGEMSDNEDQSDSNSLGDVNDKEDKEEDDFIEDNDDDIDEIDEIDDIDDDNDDIDDDNDDVDVDVDIDDD